MRTHTDQSGTSVSGRPLATDGGDGTPTVLLAEDDDDYRETLQIWAPDGRWEILEAGDGAAALEKVDDTIDALVLDRRMPELSGPEVIDQLEQTSFEGPVVVLSAFRPDRYLSEDDVALYLTKPIDRDTFINALETVVPEDR